MTQFGQHPFTAARDPLPGPPLPMPSTGVTTAPDPPALSWDGMPDDEPAVLFRRSVVSPDGYRYISDEINHRIQIVEPAGRTRDLGGTGSRAGEFRYPRGLAVLSTGTPATTRLFVCDAWNHRIQVLDGQGAVVGGFGGHGAGPGQLDVPSDVVLVRPRFAGETPDDNDPDILMLAVADSWNCRVQIFDLTGACVGAVGGANETQGVEGDMQPATRQGWPFLRTGSHPVLTFPTRLTWRSPHLEVHCAGGVVRRVDLAYAMLPTFSTWRAACSEPALSAARAYFRGRSGGPELPAAALAQMETDLGGAMLARGDVGSAAALWAEAWPAGLDRPGMKGQLAQRCERMLPGVGRRGGADLVRTVAAQVARLRHPCPVVATPEGSQDQVGHQTPSATGDGRTAGRLFRLLTVAAQRAGARSSAAEVIWSAPDGERALGPLAVGGDEIALVSPRARALWVFDRALSPLRRVSLDRSLGPSCLSADPRGGWLVGDEGWGRLIRVDGTQHAFESGWTSHGARYHVPVAMTAVQDRLYVAERERDRVVVRDLSGRVLGGYRDIPGPLSLAIAGQSLWISTSRPAGLRCVDLHSGHSLVSVEPQELISPVQIAPVGNGTMLVADASAGCVHAFAVTGDWLGRLDEVRGCPAGAAQRRRGARRCHRCRRGWAAGSADPIRVADVGDGLVAALDACHLVPFSPPSIGASEIDDVVATLQSGWLTTGPRVAAFEREFADYLGAGHAVAVNSCTAALHLSLLAGGVGPGDEVVTTPLTFCATANAIIHAGATPVFADIDPVTMNLDPEAVSRALTSCTRGILPVHFAGRPADVTRLRRLADDAGALLVEDAAHCLEGASGGRKIGTTGDLTCFSFYATKNLTTGEGGMVATDSEEWASAIRTMSRHGLSRDAWRRAARARGGVLRAVS